MRTDEMLKVEELRAEVETFRGKLAEQCGQTFGARAEVERLTELIKQMQVMGRAVDNIAAAALKPKP